MEHMHIIDHNEQGLEDCNGSPTEHPADIGTSLGVFSRIWDGIHGPLSSHGVHSPDAQAHLPLRGHVDDAPSVHGWTR